MATRAAKLALRGKALSDTGTEIGIVNNADATAITIDASENVGIGVVPYANTLGKSLDFVGGGQLFGYGDGFYSTGNLTYDSAWKLKNTGSGSATLLDGMFKVYTTASGSAGATATLTERMRIDAAGNVGIGVVPEGHHNTHSALQVGGNGVWTSYKPQGASGEMDFQHNAYYSQAHGGDRYISTDEATKYRQVSGAHQWYTAASGSADAAISWQYGMQINNDGIVTKPLQPAVCARPTSTGNNTISGGADQTDLPFGNVLFNNGNHYSTSTSVFTAPVAGYYFTSLNGRWETGSFVQNSYIRLFISLNNGNYNSTNIHVINGNNEAWANYMGMSCSGIVYCSAGDTLRPKGGLSGGSADMHGESSFNVYLLG